MFLQSIVTLTVLLVAPFSVGAGGMDANRINFNNINNNMTIEDIRRNLKYLDPEKLELDREARMERQRTRREKARQKIASISPDISSMQRLSKEEWDKAAQEDHPWVRRAGWNSNSNYDPYSNAGLADPSQQYDKWQQAYRMLGGFIDCDHPKVSNNHKSGDNQQNQDAGTVGCSRWMMWAAYVDPNYSGNGYDEYFGDNPSGVLDCHNPDSDWELIGVYRQEFYQYIEQISKHLWAIDEYEYVVALAGLSYMTKYECFQVGYSSDGQAIYAAVAPKAEARFEMALYTDAYCLTPNDNLGVTYDSFGLTTSMALSSQDKNGENGNGNGNAYNYDGDMYTWWSDTQEYTFTQLNDVYESYKYCTSCVDYPTYQDGYFIGDYGTDDDDLINQCWKFYSHNSYTCDADCISLGHAQGTILSVNYGGVVFGETLSEFYTVGTATAQELASAAGADESRWTRMLSNVFVSFAFIVFVATFLAFAVARRSRHRERSSGRSRRLLDSSRQPDGDGVFRSSSRATRSKSRAGSGSGSRSKSASRRSSSRKERTGGGTYEPPSTRSKSTRSKSSRRHIDDF